ncbi:helix-turn-helix domain-containing protein [Bosea minatitlanensis]|uniref:Helix-turn-helix domain-containing protein n=1 Tax=Bosea minatitlanensis TaxID=128782 RepID=A0ABW0F0H2_9HYPH|nr:helix-turn-helix domain-containing protein [Bosea minatitlanensis]MCT4492999.1 helix-turn-helix domain-containing protein [Bosea minatitlanensis]
MATVRRSLSDLRDNPPTFDRARIEATTDAEILRHQVEDGEITDEDVKTIRLSLHMTQERFATAIRVPLATLRNWEQGRTPPDPAARSLLTIIAKEPELALKALAA